jgi:Ca2+-binding EF-hand superfamily protein
MMYQAMPATSVQMKPAVMPTMSISQMKPAAGPMMSAAMCPMVPAQTQLAPATETPWGGGCPWQSDKTEFKQWCKMATQNPSGKERKELYGFLSECFLDADGDRDGMVGADEFDFLVEKAASLPRRFGLAPSWVEFYGNIETRMQARKQMFDQMDSDKTGKVRLEEWVRFAIAHITEKVRTMKDVIDFQHLERVRPEDFVKYCNVAVSNRNSEEYKSLYEHLFKTFVESDVEENGAIRRSQFDVLIEDAAKAPRILGLAPSSVQAYPTEMDKIAARDQLFAAMDSQRRGFVSFSDFLNWTVQHVSGKVMNYTPWGGGCPWQSDKTEFKQWCKIAIQNPNGSERRELYGFLSECFLDADGDRDGVVGADEFDFLVEKAASLPRRFGLAPSWVEYYGTMENRLQARKQMFSQMDSDNTGKIRLEEWVSFAIGHITEKVRTMKEVMDFQHLEKARPDDFVRYCEVAVTNRASEEYKSLYEHLFKTFVESDVEENGAIRRIQFDVLIEDAAKAPRVLGLAPSSAQAYPTQQAKIAARDQLFAEMDVQRRGFVSFSDFLNWSVQHIAGKVNSYKSGGARLVSQPVQMIGQPNMVLQGSPVLSASVRMQPGAMMVAAAPQMQATTVCPVSGRQGMCPFSGTAFR